LKEGSFKKGWERVGPVGGLGARQKGPFFKKEGGAFRWTRPFHFLNPSSFLKIKRGVFKAAILL
jgi:hypothetical protein